MRKILVGFGVLLAPVLLCGEEITLPAAASIVGGAPFYSDVRAFNTSYASALAVTARYRCFIPSPCPGVGAPQIQFTLAPREARAFDNMVELTFLAPNTAGGVEFDFSGGSDQLVVTSRLYSTAPVPTVGMFIPGLKNGEAHARTVLTSIRNGGFRTNVGVFNREDSAVDVTFRIFDGGAQVGSGVSRSVPGHSGVQVSGIFAAAGQGARVTEDAVVTVTASGEVFSYAAVLDNATTDPIFVRGAEDRAPVAAATLMVHVGQGGSAFKDDQSQSTTTEARVGDSVTWVWEGTSLHGVTSGTCRAGGDYGEVFCDADGLFASGSHQGPFQYTHTFTTTGSFDYYCPVHGAMMRGRVVVGAAGGSARQP